MGKIMDWIKDLACAVTGPALEFIRCFFSNSQKMHIDTVTAPDDFEKKFDDFLSPYREKERELKIAEKWDSMSVCKDDAIAFAHKYINEEPEKYSDERHLKYSYAYVLAHCGETINSRFRHNSVGKEEIECAKLVAMHSNDVPLILHRGIGKEVCKMMYESAFEMEDVDLYEASFLYCSLVKGNEIPSQYHLRIFVPEASQVFYTGNVNDEQHFYEVDIQVGGKLEIVSVDNKYINCRLIGTSNEFLNKNARLNQEEEQQDA